MLLIVIGLVMFAAGAVMVWRASSLLTLFREEMGKVPGLEEDLSKLRRDFDSFRSQLMHSGQTPMLEVPEPYDRRVTT